MEQAARERQQAARQRLARLLENEDSLDVVDGALAVAAEEYPDLDARRVRRRIDGLAEGAARRLTSDNPFARLDGLRAYMFEELGFCGNVRDYYDPRNSYLNEVLDRRTGIPLTLSILYMEAARRAGFGARGVALPGHFVVRMDHRGRRILVDPFHGGRVITEDDCRDLVERHTGRPELFDPAVLEGSSPRAVLRRLLRNLRTVYLSRQDYPRALAAVERLLLVDPDATAELRDRGFIQAHLGRLGAAVTDLRAYLRLVPQAQDAGAVRNRLAWLERRLA